MARRALEVELVPDGVDGDHELVRAEINAGVLQFSEDAYVFSNFELIERIFSNSNFFLTFSNFWKLFCEIFCDMHYEISGNLRI